MQFVKLLFETLKEFYTKHKIACWIVLAIIIMIVTNLFQYFVDQKKYEDFDRKHHVTSYSLEDQKNMSYNDKLTFDNMRRGLINERSAPVVQEVVRTQYVYGQEPQTVFKEVQYVARGGESNIISQKTQEAIRSKADETKIIEEEKSVDVYKINHEKNFKVKVGATYLDSKGYMNYGVQYKRVEGIVHTKDMNPSHIDGGTVMWTAYQR